MDCPRIFVTWIFRTTELRFTSCESHRMPSAIVKIGLLSDSLSSYSPIKNVVVSQLVR